jgi:nicotinate-nucleotide--dimethylbenzimidazole phosphoribosyltransferase
VVGVRDVADELLSPPNSLGVLDRALDRLMALSKASVQAGQLVLVGADHLVAALGVSAYGSAVTAEIMAAAVAGEAMGIAASPQRRNAVGGRRCRCRARPIPGAVDARPRDPVGDLVRADALSRRDAEGLIAIGRGLGSAAAHDGLVALGEVGIGNTTVAAALTAALLGCSGQDTVGLGAGADTAMMSRKVDVVDQALRRARRQFGRELRDPVTALMALEVRSSPS